ncbi:MAG TPA: ferritin-like domain-containing protein [Rhodanobacteraceae bacterium]
MHHTITLPWSMDSIDYAQIDTRRMRANDDLMCLLCASSFVESGADVYAHNLVHHYDGDEEVQTWLRDHWEHEEAQHGRALAAYVTHVWPEFDWDASFKTFFAEYKDICTQELLEPSRGLEMAARCIVEMGTSTLYRAIHDSTDEPVLKALTSHIKSDEVHHYKYFYRYFRKYQAQQHYGRFTVMRVLWKRLRDIGNSESDIVLRHVFQQRHPEYLVDEATFHRHTRRIYAFVRRHLPASMAINMVLKPLQLPPRLHHGIRGPLTWAVNHFTLN